MERAFSPSRFFFRLLGLRPRLGWVAPLAHIQRGFSVLALSLSARPAEHGFSRSLVGATFAGAAVAEALVI